MREESFIISLLSNMDVDSFLQLSHSRLSLFLAFIFNMRLVAKNAIESFFFAFIVDGYVYWIRVLLCRFRLCHNHESRLIHGNKESAFNDDNGNDIFAPPNKKYAAYISMIEHNTCVASLLMFDIKQLFFLTWLLHLLYINELFELHFSSQALAWHSDEIIRLEIQILFHSLLCFFTFPHVFFFFQNSGHKSNSQAHCSNNEIRGKKYAFNVQLQYLLWILNCYFLRFFHVRDKKRECVNELQWENAKKYWHGNPKVTQAINEIFLCIFLKVCTRNENNNSLVTVISMLN